MKRCEWSVSWLVVSLLVVGCHGNVEELLVDSLAMDAGGEVVEDVSGGAEPVPSSEGLSGHKKPSRHADAGTASDAGSVTPRPDAGTATPDAGAVTADAGTAITDGGTPVLAPTTTASFTPVSEDFKNPERGFFYGYQGLTDSEGSYAWLANPQADLPGYTLVGVLVRLDLYRSGPLPQAKLTELSNALGRIRSAGLKVVLRFEYWDPGSPVPGDPNPGDASESVILGHIAQLAPLLQANADVIAMMHAGFIGPWGEWHHATNTLTNNTDPFQATAPERNILDALLRALPPTRMVQLRYPAHKMAFYGSAPLTAAQAFSGADVARVGHHNDCYFASFNDFYTYPEGASVIASQKAYVAAETLYTPHGGETCNPDPTRIGCSVVVPEMAQLHTSNLNRQYNADILASWKANGCFAEISRRMGYRLELVTATHSSRVSPGGLLDLSFRVRNVGFATLHNPRPVFVVLDQGSTRYAAQLLSVDPRRWNPGAETTVTTRLRLPAGAPVGTYRLSLWMPDDAPGLRATPAYSVRFANAGTWDPGSGLNVLVPSLPVSVDAGGAIDSGAQAFVEVP